jgi:hypothetical protein
VLHHTALEIASPGRSGKYGEYRLSGSAAPFVDDCKDAPYRTPHNKEGTHKFRKMYGKMTGAHMSAGSEIIAATLQAARNADREYFRIRFLRLSPSRGDKRKGIGVMKRNPAAPGRRPRRAENVAESGSRLTSWEFAVAQAYAWKNQELKVAHAIQIN